MSFLTRVVDALSLQPRSLRTWRFRLFVLLLVKVLGTQFDFQANAFHGIAGVPRDRSRQCACQKAPIFQLCLSGQVEESARTCSTRGYVRQLEVQESTAQSVSHGDAFVNDAGRSVIFESLSATQGKCSPIRMYHSLSILLRDARRVS